jgi:cation:H+ antiporter
MDGAILAGDGGVLAGSALLTLAGLLVLLYSGDCLVRGALAAAYKANVSPLLVGILIVGFGTSIPEWLVTFQAAAAGRTGLAHGNIIGSNIANVWLVIALPAIIFPIAVTAKRMRTTALFMLAATAAWIGVTATIGLQPLVGYVFLGALAVYALIAFSVARKDMTEDTAEELKIQATPGWRMVTLILIGLVGLPLGATVLVEGGITVANATGFSEEAVGLTLLAVGTALPELGAGLAAAFRKQSDVAMGNIVGSNIFNILGAGGSIALLGHQELSAQFQNYSHWALGLSALMITLAILTRHRIGVVVATVFLLCYAGYIAGLIANWQIADLRYLIFEPPA